MKTIVLVAVVFLTITTFMFTMGYTSVFEISGTWRYKMTVTINTPEGLKIGSAVREVQVSRGMLLMPQSLPSVKVTGEAVVIDLGQRGVVFALLSGGTRGSDYADAVLYKAIPVPNKKAPLSPEGINYYSHLGPTDPVALAQDNLPMFVRFRDPADPKTVENLLEFTSCPNEHGIPDSAICLTKDRFAEAFGAGVALKSVTVEMTDEPVTDGIIAKYIPWLEERAKLSGYIGADPSDRIDPSKTWLTPSSFHTKGI